MHGYAAGTEFGPGGLYYMTAGPSGPQGTTNGIKPRLHPKLPVQDDSSLWTFDGTFPPKLAMVRYGEPVLFRHYNALPISPTANRGFGINQLTTHLHNGHTPAESDGFAGAYFFPGQFYDYRWPMILSAHGRLNTDATGPKSGTPDGYGGIVKIPGDWQETMSTLWFHDHRVDHTAENVYKGMAAMMNVYSGGRSRARGAQRATMPTPPTTSICASPAAPISTGATATMTSICRSPTRRGTPAASSISTRSTPTASSATG